MHIAASHGDVSALRLLLDYESDVHIEYETDDSSLHAAVAIQLLSNHGADAKITDNIGDTALHKLAKWHSATLGVYVLLNDTVDVNIKRNIKFLASFLATWDGCGTLVEPLGLELKRDRVSDSRGNGVAEYLVVNPKNQKVGTATVGAKAARQD